VTAAVVAIFGPTAVGKTAVAIELAKLYRARGADPVAVSCDAIQVYRGLEVTSGAAAAAQHHEGARAGDQHHLHRELLLGLAALTLFAFGRFPFGSFLDLVFGHARVP
jgi:tRNA A37 N6-isopentenylltransferase MiaA